MGGDSSDRPLASIYEAGDEAALEAEYDSWADNYDADTAAGGYRLPFLVAAFVTRYLPATDAAILDAGAGTGLAGDGLSVLGYSNITAIDLSQKMLKRAEALKVYTRLERMTLGEKLAFDSDLFDGVISTGVFTEGHAPPSSFDELVRITKPGGYVIFTVRDDVYLEKGFKEKQASLEAKGAWKLIEMTAPIRAYTASEAHIRCFFFVYRVA